MVVGYTVSKMSIEPNMIFHVYTTLNISNILSQFIQSQKYVVTSDIQLRSSLLTQGLTGMNFDVVNQCLAYAKKLRNAPAEINLLHMTTLDKTRHTCISTFQLLRK